MKKWMENELTSPYEIYPPPHKTTPPEIKNILTSPKTPKFQNSPPPANLAGVAHYAGPFCFSKSCPLKGTGLERKNKVNFLRIFDNPLSKYLILKKISYMQ